MTETIKQRLLQQGYTTVHEYDDPANEVFTDHDHEGEQCIVVLRGRNTVTLEGQEHILDAGDELIVPAKAIHSAKIGPEGCLYLVGERG